MAAGYSLTRRWKLRKLEQLMRNANSFSDWQEMAAKHDRMSGAEEWKQREHCDLYDARQIRKRYKALRQALDDGDMEEVLFALNEGIHGNMAGMGNRALYRQAKLGTKVLIDDYVNLIIKALKLIADVPESQLPIDEKLNFFRRASHCYGRSALALSGGAGLIYFHHGVVDTLLKHDLLPNVISGASAGAWTAAQIGTRSEAELTDYFLHKRYEFEEGIRLGDIFGISRGKGRADLENERDDVIDSFVENMTFQEAFEHTGRYINVSVAPVERHQRSRLLNAIASPNVTIRSAIKASCSVPGLAEPVELEAKDSRGRTKPYLRSRRWYDGSLAEDLPFKRLSRMYGINHYIVSMINPVARPFLAADPNSSSDSLAKSARTLLNAGFQESLQTTRRWLSPVTLGLFDPLFATLHHLTNQDYVGDINIVLDSAHVFKGNTLFNYRENDIERLIAAGQRETWPKLEQIKNSVRISRVIDDILQNLDKSAVTRQHERYNAHMVM